MRQDVGQDDCGLNILNKRQRVGIIYIYYYQVANFIQRWNCILCHGLLQDKRQQKKGDDVSICCSKCLKYPFFYNNNCAVTKN